MAVNNPFPYLSRTFDDFLNDINSDSELRDKPNWWKRGLAGIGDVFSLFLDAVANNTLLPTAYTRKNVQDLLQLIDYYLTPHTTAAGILLFYISGDAIFPFTVVKSDLVAFTPGNISISAKRFESRADQLVTLVSETFTATEVDTVNNQITVTRNYTTGEKVRFTTSGTLPTGLAIDTDYYVIRVSSTLIKIASSLLNALNNTNITLSAGGSGTHTIKLYSVQITCYQQQSKDQYIIGNSDGVTENQKFDLADINILRDTLEITINSQAWTRVDTFIDSISTDRHYKLYYNDDNSSYIIFGNGTYGAIPGNFDIYAEYATGGGTDSNISTINKVNVYGGADTNIAGVTNPEVLTGGADQQNLESAKLLGPMLLKSRDRFVTELDGETLALAYGGLSQVSVVKNYFGVLSAKVVGIATGGGNPNNTLKTALYTYLLDRTILESIYFRVEDTTITPINVTSAAKVLGSYIWSGQVEEWFRLGWKLFLSEAGKEIYDDFIANGVDSARTIINNIFTENYTSNDNVQISRFLNNFNYRIIGEGSVQRSDYISFLASYTIGIDYITVTSPAGDIAVASDEITTYGTLTLTEIP